MKSKACPNRCLLFFWVDPASAESIPIPLPSRNLRRVGFCSGIFFVIMAAIALGQITRLSGHPMKSVFDLMTFLFSLFWVLGWSVGVFILGTLTALFLFYGESARLQAGSLFWVFHLGPIHIRSEYRLEKIRNLRIEKAPDHPPGSVRIRFDYGEGSAALGDVFRQAYAEQVVAAIEQEMKQPGLQDRVHSESSGIDLLYWIEKIWKRRLQQMTEHLPAVEPVPLSRGPHSLSYFSAGALITANLFPIAGVLFWHWDLSEIMVLFWAESAVIGFYNVLKMTVVGKWTAMLAAPFFIGHYGGFMAAHFLFIHGMFIRGMETQGPDLPVMETLSGIFVPLCPALLVLWISHGISFVTHFLKRKEYAFLTLEKLMADPYRRIMVMHLTLILGGWLILLLKTPMPAMLLLILLKTAADLRAHHLEHTRIR